MTGAWPWVWTSHALAHDADTASRSSVHRPPVATPQLSCESRSKQNLDPFRPQDLTLPA